MKTIEFYEKGNDLYSITYSGLIKKRITRYAIYREGFKISKNSEPICSGFVFTDDGRAISNFEGLDVLDWMRKNKIKYHNTKSGETLGGDF